jgi:hypothetical protein
MSSKGKTRGSVMAWLGCILVVAAVIAPSASAGGKPTIERIDVDESFVDDVLTEECGVPVMTSAQGHIDVKTFPDGTGPASIVTLSIALTATSGDNAYRFRDVGSDHVQVKQDGTAILLVVGQVPFNFSGVLKIDLATDEVILEPQHSLEGNIEDACKALTA